MGKKLLGLLVKASWLLSALIALAMLAYLFGDRAYIYVPFIAASGLMIYMAHDASTSKARLRPMPDWDDYVRKQERGRKARKIYYRESSDRFAADGRRKHMEARGRQRGR